MYADVYKKLSLQSSYRQETKVVIKKETPNDRLKLSKLNAMAAEVGLFSNKRALLPKENKLFAEGNPHIHDLNALHK